MDTKDENKKLKIKKSLQQQIASAQLRLNRLQHKSKQEAKQ
ncbi:conjugal transfer protein TraD, partial [Escherichia coli]|nr:conjugal transfer protein TraD [Escherichia coli]